MWSITPVWITCLFKDPIKEAPALSVVMLKSEASRYSWISISYNPQEIWRIKICTTWSGIQKPHLFLKTRNTPRRLRITLKDHFFFNLYDFSLRYSKNKTKHCIKTKWLAFSFIPDICNEWIRLTKLPAFYRPKLNRGSISFTKNSVPLTEILQQLNQNLLAS